MESYGITDVCECLSYLLDKDIICEKDTSYKEILVWNILPKYTHKKYKKAGVLIELDKHKHLTILEVCINEILIYSGITNEW